jgi:hypothetical protein
MRSGSLVLKPFIQRKERRNVISTEMITNTKYNGGVLTKKEEKIILKMMWEPP